MSPFRYCVVIPNFNHGTGFAAFVERILRFSLPVVIVDDGSCAEIACELHEIADRSPLVTLLVNERNLGKGAAVKAGIRHAGATGHTHVIQIDADGQHCAEDIGKFLEYSARNPEAVICGIPVYDHTVPRHRLIARYITHVWVWIETLSLTIRDSMCGFRLYPLAPTLQIIDGVRVGDRMDFDTEILVRLHWARVQILSLPTKVVYPEDGVSHFRPLRDNCRITLMHTRLFLGMLIRLPWLLAGKLAGGKRHWSRINEKGMFLGLYVLFRMLGMLGRRGVRVLMYPVLMYFFLTAPQARKAIRKYQEKMAARHDPALKPDARTVFRNFREFGDAAVDKLLSWQGKYSHGDNVELSPPGIFHRIKQSGRGAVLIGSHLGNLELTRGLSFHEDLLAVNAVVYTKHAGRFQRIMEMNNPASRINLVSALDLGMGAVMGLKDKVDQGELVVIVGDRTSVTTNSRVVYADFLGEKAAFPEGPFILALALECPVYLIFCLNIDGHYRVFVEEFPGREELTATQTGGKKALVRALVGRYAERLEAYAVKAPYQWFNFYDFWKADEQLSRSSRAMGE